MRKLLLLLMLLPVLASAQFTNQTLRRINADGKYYTYPAIDTIITKFQADARYATLPNGLLTGGSTTTNGTSTITTQAATYRINLVAYSSSLRVFSSIPLAQTGKQKFLIVYAKTTGTLDTLSGAEVVSDPVPPTLPANTIMIAQLQITNAAIGSPTQPIAGASGFINNNTSLQPSASFNIDGTANIGGAAVPSANYLVNIGRLYTGALTSQPRDISATSTYNLTSTPTGILGMYMNQNIGASNTANIPNVQGLTYGISVASGATGTMGTAVPISVTIANQSATSTITSAFLFRGGIGTSSTGTITNVIGAKIFALNKGTNNTGVFLTNSGSATGLPGSGNYAIYDDTGYQSAFTGAITAGSFKRPGGLATEYLMADGSVTTGGGGGGTGDVVGPASSTDNAIARFDLATGKLIQNSTVIVSDGGDVAATSFTPSGYVESGTSMPAGAPSGSRFQIAGTATNTLGLKGSNNFIAKINTNPLSTDQIFFLPDATGSFLLDGNTATVTNKDLTSGTNTFPTFNQNTTGSAAKLTTPRNINGVAFDGTANITVTAAAGTLTGSTLAAGVTASSLTSFGTNPVLGTPSATNITLSGTAVPTYAQGKLVYNTDNETLTFFNNNSSVALDLGREIWARCYNNTGSTISNGVPVYVSGYDSGSGWLTIAPANASIAANTVAIGLTTMSIPNGTIGEVTQVGDVHGLNTASFTAGLPVYIGTTAGTLTQTAPTAPNYRYRVGMVGRSDATNGYIQVTPSTAALGNGTADQVFGMNAAGTAQEVKSIVGTANNVTITNTANTITASLPSAVVLTNGTLSTTQTAVAANTVTDGLVLNNTQTASAANQYYSPYIRFLGSGWKTTSTAASQTVEVREGLVPIQGTTAPTGLLSWDARTNAGAWGNIMTVSSSGDVTVPGVFTSSAATAFTASNASGGYSFGTGASAWLARTNSSGNALEFIYNGTGRVKFVNSGKIMIGAATFTTPTTAYLGISASTTSIPNISFATGVATQTSPAQGYMNWDGSRLYVQDASANQTIAYRSDYGTFANYTASGTGAATSIVIPHGLTGITSTSPVLINPRNAASAGISYTTIDATNVTVIYTVAPANGTNNLSYSIQIKP